MKNYLQQGDVLVTPGAKIPAGAKALKGGVLREGEHTGHAHKLYPLTKTEVGQEPFELFEVSGTMYARINVPCALKHEEHLPIVLVPNDYEIGAVLEYNHMEEESRAVAD